MDNQKMKWWQESVDEIFMGAFICVIAVAALVQMPKEGVAVATAAISAIGVYLGSKGRQKGNNS